MQFLLIYMRLHLRRVVGTAAENVKDRMMLKGTRAQRGCRAVSGKRKLCNDTKLSPAAILPYYQAELRHVHRDDFIKHPQQGAIASTALVSVFE